ncbi:hypothetical protein LIDJA_05465 [Leptospira interrogans]|uniref:Uncharacterized protein n=1 Tax=Leptospira interrogans serovar Hardjo str. Norma TaxID=1279460 RepID=A0A0M4MT82_LEPIR|nr:hypothetical protein G436_1480 [Leptospira interrogans serovar Hardjo str. Norma]
MGGSDTLSLCGAPKTQQNTSYGACSGPDVLQWIVAVTTKLGWHFLRESILVLNPFFSNGKFSSNHTQEQKKPEKTRAFSTSETQMSASLKVAPVPISRNK